MQTLIDNLSKRRRMMFYILLAIAIIGIIIDQTFDIQKTSYFDGVYNMYIVYGLIAYKLIELSILYFIFYHRHMRRLSAQQHISELQAKFEKNAKRFFMLVPHGNVIFGIISYKLTADISFFLLFIAIAISTLLLVKPTRHF